MQSFKHGGNLDVSLDFSININPLGMKKEIKESIISISQKPELLSSYPSVSNEKLIKAIAVFHEIKVKQVVIGRGVSELIMRLCSVIRLEEALLLAPCFSEYEKCLKAFDCKINYFNLKEDNDFCLDSSILDLLKPSLGIFFLTTPNNPDGEMIDSLLFEKIIKKTRDNNIYLVIDEAFLGFTEYKSKIDSIKGECNKHLIIMRSFTKLYAMAGLRVGYLVLSNESLKSKLENVSPSWQLSTIEETSAIAALSNSTYERDTISFVKIERAFLEKELKLLNIKVFRGIAPYLLIKTNVDSLSLKLLECDIAIRDCSNYRNLGIGYYRLAVKDHLSNQKLINSLKEIL